jgi:glycerol-3-phosphate dehydrogenase (NAD(P)+)
MAENDNRFRVLILGYGEMGHAMEHLLAARHHLDIWEKYPTPGFQSVILEESAPLADIVIFCLPVNPHREVITQIAPLLSNNSLCVSIAKGLDEKGQTAAQILQDVLASRDRLRSNYGLLYGPMISEEIRAGRFAFAQFGCTDRDNYRKVKACFKHSSLFIEYTPDISGISWSVILKNVYAMLFGMADELRLGDNMRGYLSVAALHEIRSIADQKGGLKNSPYHLAGLGDLITTATSENSHHHTLGRMLAREETENVAGEGIHTLEMVGKFRLFDISHYPLFQLIQNIVNQPVNVRQKIAGYLQDVYGLK